MKITEEMLYECAGKAEELWLSTFPSNDEIPEHKFSKGFERKMKKLLQTQRRSPALNRFISASKRVAVFALAVLTVSFSCLMCVEAYREKFLKIITDVFEDLSRFSISSSWSTNPELGEIKYGYLPEGMSEIDREYNSETHSQIIYFEDAEGRYLEISQDIMISGKESTLIVDTEDAEVSTINLNGREATMIVKGLHTILMWEDDIFIMLVSGDFPPDEILKVASEIRILEK